MLAKIKNSSCWRCRCAVALGIWECGVTNKTYDKKIKKHVNTFRKAPPLLFLPEFHLAREGDGVTLAGADIDVSAAVVEDVEGIEINASSYLNR